MLGEFPRHTRHVLGGPREDVPVLTEELDELAFLFVVQARPHGDELGLVAFVEVDLLCILCRLEARFTICLDRFRLPLLLLAGLAFELLQFLVADHDHGHVCAISSAGDGALVVSGDGDDPAWTW